MIHTIAMRASRRATQIVKLEKKRQELAAQSEEHRQALCESIGSTPDARNEERAQAGDPAQDHHRSHRPGGADIADRHQHPLARGSDPGPEAARRSDVPVDDEPDALDGSWPADGSGRSAATNATAAAEVGGERFDGRERNGRRRVVKTGLSGIGGGGRRLRADAGEALRLPGRPHPEAGRKNSAGWRLSRRLPALPPRDRTLKT